VAGAIAVTTAMSAARQWYREFFWSAPAYFLSAAVAGMVALIVNHDTYVLLPLAASPLYISYKAYRMSVDRLEEERTHARELAEMIGTTRQALNRATQSEAALAAEKDRLALESGRLMVTLRTISDGVVSVDTRGTVLLMNEGAEMLTGFAHDTAVKRHIDDVLAALGLSPRVCRQAVQRALDEGVPVRLRTEPGDEDSRLVEVTGTPNRDADGHVAGAVWVLRDLTDIARIEHERAKTARLESLGVLAGGLAHDFNNILMGVVGNLSLAQAMARPGDAALLERLTSAATACNRARGVTNQLLTFSKGGAPVKTAASIHELVTECARFCLSGSPVAPKFDVPADVWAADVDTGQIGQVVQNLVLNAMQAMMPSGGTLEIGLRNVVVDEGNQPARTPVVPGKYVCVTVKDTGKGISEEHLTRIFDPYFTTKEKGSGLGLAISYSIVRAHGGVITVESEVGVGSTFSVYLPASIVVVSEPVEARPRMQTVRTPGGRVLLMDDELMVGEVAQQMLESLGYEAELTMSGAEAIDRFRAAEHQGSPFVAVILDLTVPGGMGGAEAVTHIKTIRADVPVIVTSGYADDPVMAKFHEYGFDGVLPKPFPIPALRRALAELEIAPAARSAA
jgi:PAS domain S-box-containing protein